MPISWTDGRLSFKSPLGVVAGVLWRSRERKTLKCRGLKQQLEEAQRSSARQERGDSATEEGNPGIETTGAAAKPKPATGAEGMLLASGFAAEGTQVRSPPDSVGGESGADRRLACQRASSEDDLGVAGRGGATARLDDNSYVAATRWRGGPARACRAGQRLGLDGGSLQSNRA